MRQNDFNRRRDDRVAEAEINSYDDANREIFGASAGSVRHGDARNITDGGFGANRVLARTLIGEFQPLTARKKPFGKISLSLLAQVSKVYAPMIFLAAASFAINFFWFAVGIAFCAVLFALVVRHSVRVLPKREDARLKLAFDWLLLAAATLGEPDPLRAAQAEERRFKIQIDLNARQPVQPHQAPAATVKSAKNEPAGQAF